MNRIIWRKWVDPIAPLAKGYQPAEDENDPDFHDAVKSFGFDDDPVALERRPTKGSADWTGPAIVGPIGIVPLHETNLPSALFNFWMADTTFDLTDEVVEAIERVPGVETLDVFTRYRFRLGIGRAFQETEVKRAIEQAVQPPAPKEQAVAAVPAADPLDRIKRLLTSKFSHWAIFVLPGGKYEYAGGGSAEEVTEKAKKYVGVAQRTILSWEKS